MPSRECFQKYRMKGNALPHDWHISDDFFCIFHVYFTVFLNLSKSKWLRIGKKLAESPIVLRMTFGNPLRRPPQETPSGEHLVSPSGELLVSTSGESLLTPSKEPLRRAFVDSLRRIVISNFYYFCLSSKIHRTVVWLSGLRRWKERESEKGWWEEGVSSSPETGSVVEELNS